ncbi:hypothetical protein CR513_26501, partial [Mucuna pruriens]
MMGFANSSSVSNSMLAVADSMKMTKIDDCMPTIFDVADVVKIANFMTDVTNLTDMTWMRFRTKAEDADSLVDKSDSVNMTEMADSVVSMSDHANILEVANSMMEVPSLADIIEVIKAQTATKPNPCLTPNAESVRKPRPTRHPKAETWCGPKATQVRRLMPSLPRAYSRESKAIRTTRTRRSPTPNQFQTRPIARTSDSSGQLGAESNSGNQSWKQPKVKINSTHHLSNLGQAGQSRYLTTTTSGSGGRNQYQAKSECVLGSQCHNLTDVETLFDSRIYTWRLEMTLDHPTLHSKSRIHSRQFSAIFIFPKSMSTLVPFLSGPNQLRGIEELWNCFASGSRSSMGVTLRDIARTMHPKGVEKEKKEKQVLDETKKGKAAKSCLFALGVEKCMTRNGSNILYELDPEIDRTLRRLGKVMSYVVSNSSSSNSISNFDYTISVTNDFDFFECNSSNINFDCNFGLNNFQEPNPMENNDRTFKELAMPNVVYQPWCIQYPQLEPAQSYKLKSGLIHLLPRFHGLVRRPPQAFKRISCGLLHNDTERLY